MPEPRGPADWLWLLLSVALGGLVAAAMVIGGVYLLTRP